MIINLSFSNPEDARTYARIPEHQGAEQTARHPGCKASFSSSQHALGQNRLLAYLAGRLAFHLPSMHCACPPPAKCSCHRKENLSPFHHRCFERNETSICNRVSHYVKSSPLILNCGLIFKSPYSLGSSSSCRKSFLTTH